MAHLKNPVTGTEVEVDDDTAKAMTGDGWEVSGDGTSSGDDDGRRRKAPRKGTDGA